MAGEADRPSASAAESIFLAALERSSPERPGFLTDACGTNKQLRQRVQALLKAHEAPQGFLPDEVNPESAENFLDASISDCAGDTIGRYKLRQRIGEGGCGVVYLAEQTEPVRRRVALKIIKLGMDTRQVIARFEAERQALALMDHPNIARVLDAGATDLGRPYFVMELVGGVKITDYCDQNNFSTRQRLDLFIQVCRAIQHAHQKGVIHRDIKPSNILVAMHDGIPVPKVIDFGIAKATQGRLTDHTVFTAFEQFIGTPAYMSPEQAQLGGLDVDTRSDIYSLGVLLYELLTGKTPFDSKDLLAAGLEAMRRTIQEKEPVTPSTRLKQELAAGSARADNSALRTPHSKIDRDLDWIAIKCLEKNRGRRYETANGLAMDVERYLKNEPVVAGPPTGFYRLQKAVRRHKTAFAAAAIITAVLFAAVFVSGWEAIRATKAKAQAVAEKHRADEETAKQEAINGFLNDMLASADPYQISPQDQVKGANMTMLQVIDAAAQRVKAGSLKDRPAIEAAICQTLGRTYLNLVEPSKAEPLLRKALELNRGAYGEQNENTIDALKDLVGVHAERGELQETKQMEQQIISLERKLHGKEHPHVAAALLRLAVTLDAEARSYLAAATIAQAARTFSEALDMQRKLLPPDSPELISALQGFAKYLAGFAPDRSDQAESMLREALRIQTRVGGRHHPETAALLNSLAQVLMRKGDYAGAETLCREAVVLQREFFDTNHLELAATLGTLGDALQRQQRFSEAEAAYREGLAIHIHAHPRGGDTTWYRKILAENLTAQNRFGEAANFYREVLDYWERVKPTGGVGGESYWQQFEAFVKVLKADDKPDEIENAYRALVSRQEKACGDTHVAVPAMLCQWGDFLLARDKSSEANDLYRRADQLIPNLGTGRNRPATLSLVKSLRSRERLAEAEKVYERLLQAESHNPEHPNFFLGQLFHDYGDFLCDEHKFQAAVDQYLKALPIKRGNQDSGLEWTLRSVGSALIECSKPAEGERYLREASDLYRAHHQGEDIYGTAWPIQRVGDALVAQGKLREAEQSYREAILRYRKVNASQTKEFRKTVNSLAALLKSEGKLASAQAVLDDNAVEKGLKTAP
jgi:eukaryotic-like serine/threonine-protein kinase